MADTSTPLAVPLHALPRVATAVASDGPTVTWPAHLSKLYREDSPSPQVSAQPDQENRGPVENSPARPACSEVLFRVPIIDELKTELESALSKAMRHRLAKDHFNQPIDVAYMQEYGCTDYLEIVTSPMDLGTIMDTLSSGRYENVEEFIQDCMLVFRNCKLYNGAGSPAYENVGLVMLREWCHCMRLIIPPLLESPDVDVEWEWAQTELKEFANISKRSASAPREQPPAKRPALSSSQPVAPIPAPAESLTFNVGTLPTSHASTANGLGRSTSHGVLAQGPDRPAGKAVAKAATKAKGPAKPAGARPVSATRMGSDVSMQLPTQPSDSAGEAAAAADALKALGARRPTSHTGTPLDTAAVANAAATSAASAAAAAVGEALQPLVAEATATLGQVRSELVALRAERDSLVPEIHRLREERNSTAWELHQLRAERGHLAPQVETLRTDNSTLAAEVAARRTESAALLTRIQQMQGQAALAQTQMNQLRTDAGHLSTQRSALQAENSRLATQLNQLRTTEAQLRASLAQLE